MFPPPLEDEAGEIAGNDGESCPCADSPLYGNYLLSLLSKSLRSSLHLPLAFSQAGTLSYHHVVPLSTQNRE